MCTLALRISRSLTTPCAPKDLSISVKHWLVSQLSPFLPVPPCSLIHVLPDATLLPCLPALSLVLARKPCVRVRVQMAAVRCSR